MTNYKLIKELPFMNSPQIGYISKPKDNSLHYWNHNWFDPVDYPEYWEKVEEKDYQILSFYRKDIAGKGDTHVDPEYIWLETHPGNGKWSRKGHITNPYTTQKLLNHNDYGIHSVKRLSDGEVFTVGDYIISHTMERVQITKIFIDNIGLYFGWGSGNTSLVNTRVCKKPLFTTEDGVDIIDGDASVWGTNNKSFYEPTEVNVLLALQVLKGNDNFKYFSTKEAAEEYILHTKPCLSINDVIIQTGLFKPYSGGLHTMKKRLIKIAKQKLNDRN